MVEEATAAFGERPRQGSDRVATGFSIQSRAGARFRALRARRAVSALRFRARMLLLAGMAGLCLTACRVDAAVEIRVDDVGTGLVSVLVVADADALARVPELASGLRLDDARDAGWTVEGPTPRGDGGVEVGAWKRFESASQLPAVLDELAGAGVIFTDVRLEQSRSFARTDYDFGVSVNPSPPLAAFSDDAVAAMLDGHYLGRPIDELVAAAWPLEDALELEFSLTLPESDEGIEASPGTWDGKILVEVGGNRAFAPEVDGSTATWRFSYGDQPVRVGASTTLGDSGPTIWRIVAGVTAAVFAVVLLVVAIMRVVNLVRTPRGRGRRATRRRKQRAAMREAEASRPRKRMLRLLVVDVHGVIVRPTDPREGLLLPVILQENPDIDPDLVRDRHRKLVLGRLTAEEFWSDLGLGPIGREVETRYLSSFKLVPGLHPFLDRVSARSLPVAAVGNQPKEWGQRLQRMAELEDSVSSWLVSGDVGAVLPEPPLFEATRRVMSVDLYDCLYLSSVPEYLDAAAEMGMATGYFAVSPEDVQETEHTLVRGFDDILKGRTGGA